MMARPELEERFLLVCIELKPAMAGPGQEAVEDLFVRCARGRQIETEGSLGHASVLRFIDKDLSHILG
jgi:hypothetical protein